MTWSTEEIESFRTQLVALKETLDGEDAAAKASIAPVTLDQGSVGRLSRMDAMQAQQMALAAARRREGRKQSVEGALRRIAEGEFGECYVCGEDIDARRLAFDPAVTRCVGCVGAKI